MIKPSTLIYMLIATGSLLRAEVIVFHFDSSNIEFNPSFSESGLEISFSTDTSLNSNGVAQFVSDDRANPFSGPGNLRLSSQGGGPELSAAFLDLPIAAHRLELYAAECDSTCPGDEREFL